MLVRDPSVLAAEHPPSTPLWLNVHAIVCQVIYFLNNVFLLYCFQFDTYVKSLSIEPQTPMFRIVTDGQLPIRQCLHREASIKDIELPEYYNVFHDLRKDFSKFYNAPQEQTFNSITDLVICILLPHTKKHNFNDVSV